MYFIVRQVRTLGKQAQVKEKIQVTFWTGLRDGFGVRHFAKPMKTIDEVRAELCVAAAWYYNKPPAHHPHDLEVVREVSPGEYRSAKHELS